MEKTLKIKINTADLQSANQVTQSLKFELAKLGFQGWLNSWEVEEETEEVI